MKYTNQILGKLRELEVSEAVVFVSNQLGNRVCAENGDIYMIGDIEVKIDYDLSDKCWYWTPKWVVYHVV